MKNTTILLMLTLGLSIFSSCKKYPDGGLTSKADERIQKSWKLDKYYLDGVDATSQLLISNYVETYSNGVYTRKFNDENGDLIEQTGGTYSFDADKMKISISGVGSVDLTANNSTVSTSSIDVLRLKKDEYWYSFSNGGATHEFHLVPN